MRRLARVGIVILVLVLLSGCGNKGPLVLPDAPAAASTAPAPPATSD